jgi:hypothetical protein
VVGRRVVKSGERAEGLGCACLYSSFVSLLLMFSALVLLRGPRWSTSEGRDGGKGLESTAIRS